MLTPLLPHLEAVYQLEYLYYGSTSMYLTKSALLNVCSNTTRWFKALDTRCPYVSFAFIHLHVIPNLKDFFFHTAKKKTF